MSLRLLLLTFLVVLPLKGQVRVINEGFPGENTAELNARLDRLLAESHPGFVVLFAGTNDALNEGKFLSAEDSGAHIESMVRRIKAQGSEVVLVTLHSPDLKRLMARHKPEAYGSTPPLQRLARVNDQLFAIAKREKVKVAPFADALEKAGGANQEMSTDGVHLTAKGYRLLAETVRTEFPLHLPPNSTVLCLGDSLTYGIGVRAPKEPNEGVETYPAQLQTLLK